MKNPTKISNLYQQRLRPDYEKTLFLTHLVVQSIFGRSNLHTSRLFFFDRPKKTFPTEIYIFCEFFVKYLVGLRNIES